MRCLWADLMRCGCWCQGRRIAGSLLIWGRNTRVQVFTGLLPGASAKAHRFRRGSFPERFSAGPRRFSAIFVGAPLAAPAPVALVETCKFIRMSRKFPSPLPSKPPNNIRSHPEPAQTQRCHPEPDLSVKDLHFLNVRETRQSEDYLRSLSSTSHEENIHDGYLNSKTSFSFAAERSSIFFVS